MSSSAILEARGLTRRFAGLVAVHDVSFSLSPGEILGFIGPNGAGKTTLISLLSGTLAPTEGEVWFDGRRIDRMAAFRRARLGIGRTFPAGGGSFTAACTVTPREKTLDVKA